jgi:hypothetical protein
MRGAGGPVTTGGAGRGGATGTCEAVDAVTDGATDIGGATTAAGCGGGVTRRGGAATEGADAIGGATGRSITEGGGATT